MDPDGTRRNGISAPSPEIEGYPTDDALNKVSPDNPVLLTHASGHALFANLKARELAGVTKDTKDPEGGAILRDPSGNPVGVFFDAAEELISRAHEEAMAKRTRSKSRRNCAKPSVSLSGLPVQRDHQL